MSQKLPVNGFEQVKKLSKFNEDFIEKYDENSNTGYFREADVNYPKKVFNLHNNLPFLQERKRIRRVEKLVCEIEDKEKHVTCIRALKQALHHGLKLKKLYRVVKFNQKAWLKTYIDMNTKYRQA